MSQYDYIIKNIRFSFSSLSSFDHCKYSWKLLYLDSENRIDNFFGQYGTVIHNVLQSYWEGEIELKDLKEEYIKLFPKIVTEPPPPYPKGMKQKYYNDGLVFFDDFDIKREQFDVISIEDRIDADFSGIKIIVKPDLVIRHKKSGEIYLLDYKSSRPLKPNGDWDYKKLKGYEFQMLLYAHFIEKHFEITIDKIALLFTRLDKRYYVEKTEEKTNEVLKWFTDTVEKIKNEEEFEYNNTNKYFCSNLCSVRSVCPYWR